MPRVYGYCPGSSSTEPRRSSEVYSGRTSMPESVLVSMPSSRLEAASNSRSQVSRLYCTLIPTPLWVAPRGVWDQAFSPAGQDLLGRGVRDAIAPDAAGEVGIAVEQVPVLGPRQLSHQVGRLAPE